MLHQEVIAMTTLLWYIGNKLWSIASVCWPLVSHSHCVGYLLHSCFVCKLHFFSHERRKTYRSSFVFQSFSVWVCFLSPHFTGCCMSFFETWCLLPEVCLDFFYSLVSSCSKLILEVLIWTPVENQSCKAEGVGEVFILNEMEKNMLPIKCDSPELLDHGRGSNNRCAQHLNSFPVRAGAKLL